MTPRQVRSVLMVVKCGSVNQAAAALHLAPSSVSAQLKELSVELGVDLFERLGRRIVLSGAGRQLLPRFQEFAQLVDQITQEAQSIQHEPSGVLKLFAPSSMCIYRLPELIEALHKHAPQVEVLLTHEPFDYQSALQQGEIDAAIQVTQQASKLWQYHYLQHEQVIYVCHPVRYQANALSLKELSQKAVITTEPGCTYRSCVEAQFKAQGLLFKPRQSFANVEVIRRCLLANMGIGLLPYCVVAEDLEAGRLVQLEVEGAPYLFDSALIYPTGRQCSPKLCALIDVVEHSRGC